MVDWQRKMKLFPFVRKYEAGEITIQQLAAETAKQLSELKPLSGGALEDYCESLREHFVEWFTDLSEDPALDKEEFDYALDELYDWGDIELSRNWPPKKVCWIGFAC